MAFASCPRVVCFFTAVSNAHEGRIQTPSCFKQSPGLQTCCHMEPGRFACPVQPWDGLWTVSCCAPVFSWGIPKISRAPCTAPRAVHGRCVDVVTQKT